MPGYKEHHNKEVFNKILQPVPIQFIDHCVGNQAEFEMEPTAKWYETMLDFHRFWSVDDTMMHTEFSALRKIGKKKYKIYNFVRFFKLNKYFFIRVIGNFSYEVFV